MKIFLVFLIILESFYCNEFDGFIEYEDRNGDLIKKDLIEFINNGKIHMDTSMSSNIQNKAIMVLGLSGTGKTTLVNYLNGVPLVCKQIKGSWRVDLESESNTLPGGFKIGHTEYSETQYPAVYTPPKNDFSYVDNPGFQDNRGTAYEISNSFFRENVIKKSEKIKFLLLITFQDLEVTRGRQFRDTIDRFYEFLGVFDSNEKVKTLSKSVGIVVTRVDNKEKNDDEMKTYIADKLLKVLIAAKKARKLPSPNAELVFNEIITNNQIEIVTACESKFQNQVIDYVQKDQIILLINRLEYFSRDDAQFRTRIPPDEVQPVFNYIQDRYDLFKQEFESKYDKDLNNYVESEIDRSKTIDDLKTLETELRSRKGSEDIFDGTFKNRKVILDFFVQVLKDKMRKQINQNVDELKLKVEQKLANKIELLYKLKHIETTNDGKGVRTYKGCYLKSSEIENLYQSGVKSIVLYLCQAIHFDKSVNLRGLGHLTIIAPKWSVDGKNTIEVDLTGNDGKDHTIQAVNGHTLGASGSDGEPGSVGQNGGQVFGFGQRFIKLENLIFKLDGGRGGNGQKGGNGVSSSNGGGCTIPQYRSLTSEEIAECKRKGPFSCKKRKRAETLLRHYDQSSRKVTRKRWDYQNYGTMPPPGGNGGQGGKGGNGGLAGTGIIYKVNENFSNLCESVHKIEAKNGKDGLDGESGIGAPSGCYYRCTRTYSEDSWGGFNPFNGFKEENNYWENNLQSFCEAGSPGFTPHSKNQVGLEIPSSSKDSKNLELIKLGYTIEQYKSYEKYSSFADSLNKVIIDQEVQSRIDEFKMLEQVESKEIYESLVFKAKQTKQNLANQNKQESNALDFLIAYGLSRINELDAAQGTLLIVNLNDYIKLMLKNFETLQSLKGVEFKHMYKQEYTEIIESKINEANEFLKLLLKNIQSEYTKVDVYVKHLETDVKTSIQESKDSIETLERKKRELEEAKKKKFVFGILRVVVKGVGLMVPPIGPAISGVVLAGLSFFQEQSKTSLMNFGDSVLKLSDNIKEPEAKLESLAKDLEPLLDIAKSLSSQDSGDQISQIENQIASLRSKIEFLEQYHVKVVPSFGIYMTEVIENVERFESSLGDKSNVAIVYFNRNLKFYFKTVLDKIERFVGPFEKSAKNFRSLVDTLKETLDISMVIYTKINEYREHLSFADYLTKIQSPVQTDYGRYQNDLNSLISSLQFSVVHEMYVKTVKSIEQWIFPFEAKILSDLTQLKGSQSEKVSIMKENLIKLERRIESYGSSGQVIDQAIMKMKFSESEPFYKWSGEDNQENIQSLFKGESVIFKSDIKNSRRSAVKFNQIEIKLESKLQPELIQYVEENFQVSLRHSGKSYFKYKDSYKVWLNNKPFSITFSFKKDSNGLPINRNGIYDKMINGIFSMSPYTSWIIQLQKIDNSPFNLDLVKNCDVEISLIGEGSYVDETLTDLIV